MSVESLTKQLEERVRRDLPSLSDDQAQELAGVLERLITAFQPERIYAFGSRARNDAGVDSDVDLMVIVSHSDEPGHRRDQAAYQAVELRRIPVDILVVTREEFDRRSRAPSSLPATVIREGKVLYAA